MGLSKQLFRIIRPRQWTKNVLIFVPLFFSKNIFNAGYVLHALSAVIIFSLASSAAYVFNDIQDRHADARHRRKCTRPLAAGTLSVRTASILFVILMVLSLCLAYFLNTAFFLLLLCYFLMNGAYSLFFKKVSVLDVLILVSFFLSRLFAGSLVTGIVLSMWLIFVASLVALFLGFCKRRQDLLLCFTEELEHSCSPKYSLEFLNGIILTVAPVFVGSYLCYTLHYGMVAHPGAYGLMASVPFVFYGVVRYLQLLYRKSPESDVLLVLFRDRYSQINITLYTLVCYIVLYLQ